MALALLAYEAYYARFGQAWEKMALIKARPVAGDADLGREFMDLIQPFVYQRHLDPQGVEQLRSMKRQIDSQMADKNESHTNVKLGRGGIREIEFLIQLPQLLFGGRRPELQERNLLRALPRLRDAGLLGDGIRGAAARRLLLSAPSGAPAANGARLADAYLAAQRGISAAFGVPFRAP